MDLEWISEASPKSHALAWKLDFPPRRFACLCEPRDLSIEGAVHMRQGQGPLFVTSNSQCPCQYYFSTFNVARVETFADDKEKNVLEGASDLLGQPVHRCRAGQMQKSQQSLQPDSSPYIHPSPTISIFVAFFLDQATSGIIVISEQWGFSMASSKMEVLWSKDLVADKWLIFRNFRTDPSNGIIKALRD